MLNSSRKLLVLALLFTAAAFCSASSNTIRLTGSWAFQLDPQNAGHLEKWFDRKLDQKQLIFLPGDTDQAGYGEKTIEPSRGWLTRPYKYIGAAWYQREVVIPETWRDSHVSLFLERPRWQSEVWVDGYLIGTENSLSVPHEYDVSDAMSPGAHTITICLDNSYKIDVGGRATSVAEDTQTSWNGIVGQIELRVTAPVWVDSVRIYSDVQKRELHVFADIRNRTGARVDVDLTAGVTGLEDAAGSARALFVGQSQRIMLTVPVRRAALWDEYQPSIYGLALDLSTHVGSRKITEHFGTTFGLREIATKGTQFALNGRPIFLRGTLECNIFPLTGYPPTDVESWVRLFRIARSYGLNAFRFHSYCPPEAAFTAADRAGFLLQVELPVWSKEVGKDEKLDDYMRAEGYRILKAYGNHPSFTMLCLGNELVGDDGFMDALVAEFKRSDARRLYTFAADYRRRAPGATSDYYVTQQTSAGRLRINGSRFGKTADGTDFDFTPSIEAVHMPLVAHELGQWATYPSYDEIASYTGVLKPRNLELFRKELESRGEIDQARSFEFASGRFSWTVYKEEIEAALRTPNFGGFFLLQLQDYPGQGEALIGLLDSLWNSKGIYTPEEFRRFCNPTVPLLRMAKFVWANDETFTGQAELAHYGKKSFENAAADWSAVDDEGKQIGSGEWKVSSIPTGGVTQLGTIKLPLSNLHRAAHLQITVTLRGTSVRNDWSVWIYPKPVQAKPLPKIVVAKSLDDGARKALNAGRSVLLLTSPDTTNDHLQRTRFLPVFWSNGYFNNQPGTMGILCDPSHPALKDFPTGVGSDWQWWELTESSHAFILDDAPLGFRPIVQEIDDFHRNHRLGAVIEAKVGGGRLLATSFDLVSNLSGRPVARQMLASLTAYVASDQFRPKGELSVEYVQKLTERVGGK